MRQKNVLARLRHRTVRRCNDEDRAVHLRGTRNHVLDIVGVSWRVNVRVVARIRLVFGMVQGNCNAARLFFRSVVDLIDSFFFSRQTLHVQHVRDRGGQGRLSVVNVSDRADVNVRLGPVEFFFFCHFFIEIIFLLFVSPLQKNNSSGVAATVNQSTRYCHGAKIY